MVALLDLLPAQPILQMQPGGHGSPPSFREPSSPASTVLPRLVSDVRIRDLRRDLQRGPAALACALGAEVRRWSGSRSNAEFFRNRESWRAYWAPGSGTRSGTGRGRWWKRMPLNPIQVRSGTKFGKLLGIIDVPEEPCRSHRGICRIRPERVCPEVYPARSPLIIHQKASVNSLRYAQPGDVDRHPLGFGASGFP